MSQKTVRMTFFTDHWAQNWFFFFCFFFTWESVCFHVMANTYLAHLKTFFLLKQAFPYTAQILL